MSHLVVNGNHKTIFIESEKSPIDRLAASKEKQPPVTMDDKNVSGFSQVHEILSKPCPNIVPYNFAPLIDNWQELSRVRVSSFKPSSSIGGSSDTRVSLHKPRLIELASYPGYERDSPTPLPFDIGSNEIMNVVINSQNRMKGKPSFSEYCRSNFKDSRMQNILSDLFWWIFLDSFDRNELTQQSLFVRIAITFGDFFSMLPREKNFKDRFLQILPDLLSQTIFTLFIHAYSTSWKQFDEAFKSRLCNLIHFWFSGLPPFPNSWKNWPLSKLVPESILQHNSIDLNISSTENKFSLDLDATRKKEESPLSKIRDTPKKFVLRKSPESHQIGPSYNIQRTLFRTSGHCPLMDYYLASKSLSLPPSHSLLLTHSNILLPTSTTSVTYYDFMQRYNKRAQARRNKMYALMRSTNEAISRRRMEQEKEFKQQQRYFTNHVLEIREEQKYLRQRALSPALQREDQFLLDTQTHYNPEP